MSGKSAVHGAHAIAHRATSTMVFA
jgi:hypothetical protein